MSVTAEEFDDYGDAYEEGGLSGFYVLAIFLALLAAFLVVVYFAYEKGKATAMMDDADLPVVAADPRPVRTEVPLAVSTNERTEVYDRIDGVTPTTVVADVRPGRDPMDGYSSAPATTSSTDRTQTTEKPRMPPEAKPVALPEATAPVTTSQTVTPNVATAEAKPEAKAAATPAPSKPAPAATTPVKGTHVVQVGAFGSTEEAERFYQTLSGKMGALVSSKSPDIQVADVKGKTYHRLRLAPFSSKDDAASYCADLKAKGQDCLVKGV